MKRLTGTGVVPTGEMVLPMIWNRLKEIEDILTGLGNDYDLERLKQLLTGDNFTHEDMSAAYTSGYESGRKRGEDKHCGPCPAIHAVKAMAASDLQPVVRCKDCVRWPKAKVNSKGFLICPASGLAIMATDFCSKGERRRDND